MIGSFRMVGNTVRRANKSCLLSLKGNISGHDIDFLLDSGASCNFVSQGTLHRLGIDWDLAKSQNVRLADGKLLSVRG